MTDHRPLICKQINIWICRFFAAFAPIFKPEVLPEQAGVPKTLVVVDLGGGQLFRPWSSRSQSSSLYSHNSSLFWFHTSIEMSVFKMSQLFRLSSNVGHDFYHGPIGLRYLSISGTRDAADVDTSKNRKALETMVSDEKRGIFRVLDIGLPKPMGARRAWKSDRKIVKATPRWEANPLTENIWLPP